MFGANISALHRKHLRLVLRENERTKQDSNKEKDREYEGSTLSVSLPCYERQLLGKREYTATRVWRYLPSIAFPSSLLILLLLTWYWRSSRIILKRRA